MIGLYVQHDYVRAVDIVKKRNRYVLNGLSGQPVHLPTPDRLRPFEENEEEEYVGNIKDTLRAILSARGFASRDVSIAIDIRNAFIQTVPFDGNFSKENVQKIIQWELGQYFTGYDESSFLFDTYNPGFNPARDTSPRFIYTAVFRSYIHLLQRGVRSCHLKLHSINVDQFAIENILRLAAGQSKRERLHAVCFRHDDIVYCSLLWNHRLVRYREYTLDDSHTPDERLAMFLSSTPGGQKHVEQRIYYHPEDPDTRKAVEERTGWQFSRFNAFEHLTISRKAKRSLPSMFDSQELFAPAVSVAINGDR
jgi:hypothetical protein